MTTAQGQVLDWEPPSPSRAKSNQPYRLFVQLDKLEKDLNLEKIQASRAWQRRAWLDQLKEGACTGFAIAHCLSMSFRAWPMNDFLARYFYKIAQQHDEWAGENYEGSSVLGACEGIKLIGLIEAYWWIENRQELIAALRFGPVDVGSWWTSGMWTPDRSGLITTKGTREGGHSYTVGAVDLKRNRARIDNSWGRSWGVNGSAEIDLDELCDLIFRQRGEVALLRKKPYNPATLRALGPS